MVWNHCVSCPPVPCPGPVVSPQEERPSCRHQDAQQVHQVWPQVSVCLLHAHPDRQQTAGRDRGRVSARAIMRHTGDIGALDYRAADIASCVVRSFASSYCIFTFAVTTAPCLTSLRAAWGTRMRWWCTRLLLPSSICPTARPESWPPLCQVSTLLTSHSLSFSSDLASSFLIVHSGLECYADRIQGCLSVIAKWAIPLIIQAYECNYDLVCIPLQCCSSFVAHLKLHWDTLQSGPSTRYSLNLHCSSTWLVL